MSFVCVQVVLAYYNPETGRFLSRDPLQDEAFLKQYSKGKAREERLRLQRAALEPAYVFVRNNPIVNYDPFGLDLKNDCDKSVFVYIGNKWEELKPGQTKKGDTDGVSWGDWGDHAKQAYKWIDCFDATVTCTEDGKCTVTLTYVGQKHTKGKSWKVKCACALEKVANSQQGKKGGWKDPTKPDWPGKDEKAPWPSPPDEPSE